MRHADGGISRIYRLTAGAGRTEGINAKVLGFDFDINFFGFGQHRDRYCRGVDPALLLSPGHTLHAMHAAFVFQLREDADRLRSWR